MWIHGDRVAGELVPKSCLWLDGSVCYSVGQEAVLRLHPSHKRPAGNPFTRIFEGSICFFLRFPSSGGILPPFAHTEPFQRHWEALLCTLVLDLSSTFAGLSAFLDSGSSGSELAAAILPSPHLSGSPAASSLFRHMVGLHLEPGPYSFTGMSSVVDRPSSQSASSLGQEGGSAFLPLMLSPFSRTPLNTPPGLSAQSRDSPSLYLRRDASHASGQRVLPLDSMSYPSIPPLQNYPIQRLDNWSEGARGGESDAEFAARLAASLLDENSLPPSLPSALNPTLRSSISPSGPSRLTPLGDDEGSKLPSAPVLHVPSHSNTFQRSQPENDPACVICLTAPLQVTMQMYCTCIGEFRPQAVSPCSYTPNDPNLNLL